MHHVVSFSLKKIRVAVSSRETLGLGYSSHGTVATGITGAQNIHVISHVLCPQRMHRPVFGDQQLINDDRQDDRRVGHI